MNVLYIIGNGLDISLGMKTDYQNFYDYYMSQPTLDPVILHLKESIKEGRYQTWADLEAGLGKYSGTISSDKDFLKCLSELKAYLGLYIKEKYEQKSFIWL